MKNIISVIKELISENVVNESFLKYLDDYKLDTNNKKPDHNSKKKQLQFAFNELTKQYTTNFTKEVKQITNEIKSQEKINIEDFPDFLLVCYKDLLSMYNEKELKEPPHFKFDKYVLDSKHMNHLLQLVRFQMQNEFIIPLINFIDNNYISFLFNLKIFPLPIEKLLNEIRNNNLVLKVLKKDKPTNTQFHAVYSETNKCSYYLSYNSFVDLSSYYTHLNEVVNEFENFIRRSIQFIKDPFEQMNLYSKIRLGVKYALLSFSKVDSTNIALTEYLPKNARNDTYAVFHQFINESFHESQKVKFNPDLIDFQDLQYSITKRALEYVKTKINGLRDTQEFEERASLSVDGIPSQKLFHDKIKTNLTVPQIASLFKGLLEEKDILDMKNKTDLYRSIAACFTSKRREEFKAGTVRKNFNQPDEQTIEFLIEKLTHLLQYFKNLRNNIRG